MSFARIATVSLLCCVAGFISSAAQQPGPYLTLAQLLQDAPRIGNRSVTVRCHFAQTKEGPVIYDDEHKTVFSVQWSDAMRNSAPYNSIINASAADWLVLTGHLGGGNLFIVDDGQIDDSQHIRIRIINAQTNQPVADEKLNVALRVDQIGSVAMPTDKNGVIDVTTGNAAIIRILSNMYADCRPRGELYTNYSIADIRHTGITTGNLCGGHANPAHPGELVLFEVPKTYIPGFGEPPASNLPHSDENPHSPPKPQ